MIFYCLPVLRRCPRHEKPFRSWLHYVPLPFSSPSRLFQPWKVLAHPDPVVELHFLTLDGQVLEISSPWASIPSYTLAKNCLCVNCAEWHSENFGLDFDVQWVAE